MRKVIAFEFVTLDGFTARSNGEFDFGVSDPEMDQDTHEYLKSIDAIILGRTTYQILGGFWPTATLDDSLITDQMNAIPKIIFSKTLDKVGWGKWDNARQVKESAADEIRKLKQEQPGKDMVIFGSAALVMSLAEHGLIDDYHLLLNPVALGNGMPLFKAEQKPMKLLRSKTYASGTVLLHYQVV